MAEKIIISFELDDANAIRKVKQIKKAMGDDLPAATKKADSGLKKLRQTLAVVGTAFAAIAVTKLVRGLGSLGTQVIQTGAQFETMAIQLRAVTGSTEAAGRAMDWITEFTANTPYQIEQVTDAFVKMRAFGLDPMDGTLQVVADMTSYLGGSMQKMDSIVRALGKSFARGKISMEELNMMIDAGVPATTLLSQGLGVTTAELFKMSEKGELGRDAINLLIEGMGELAGGASQNLMNSFTGLWSNLQDHITLTMKELSEGGALDGAKQGLRSLIDVLVKLRESGKLDQWGAQLGEIFNTIADVLVIAIENFDTFLKAYYAFVGSFWAVTSKIAKAAELYVKLSQAMILFAGEDTRRQMEELRRTLGDLAVGAEDFAYNAGEQFAELSAGIRTFTADSEDMGETVANTTTPALENLTEQISYSAAATSVMSGQILIAGDNFRALVPELVAGSRSFHSLYQEVESTGPAAVEATNMIASSFSDLLGKGFIGELETFSDLWDSIWQDLAKSMMGILSDAFEGVFESGAGGASAGIGNFLDALEQNRLGSSIAGAGLMASGAQQGGFGGIMSGMMGGGMLGFGIGSLLGGGGGMIGMAGLLGGPIGLAIGAVVGGALAAFGGEGQPRARGSISMTDGSLTTLNQNMSGRAEGLWVQQRIEEYRGSVMEMNNVLRLFGEGELFDLIREAPTFEFGGGANPIEGLAQVFSEQWLPNAMRRMFRRAINTGLGGLGVDRDTIHQLWSEVGDLTGTNQITALETFIGSLVGLTNLYDDMDWQAIQDASRQDSLTAFLGGMGDALSGVQNQMLGLDSMSLLERADQAQSIEQLITQARGAEIQMLQQIDSLQQSINRSIDQQIEGLRVGGMSQGEAQRYYRGQIDSLMGQLRGGATSPEMVQQLMGDLQRYVGSYQSSLGDALYTQGAGGSTYANELISILEEARGLSNDALEGMRDQIRESNEALISELQRLIQALQHWGDSVATGEGAVGPAANITGQFEINVHASDGFWAEVDARIESQIAADKYAGPN